MAEKKTKEEISEELIPYKCYACERYDGTFGPSKDEHTHVCKTCKELPTEIGVIEHHQNEYFLGQARLGEEALGCERCGLERDECVCPDNIILRNQISDIQASFENAAKPDSERVVLREEELEELLLEMQEVEAELDDDIFTRDE